MKGIYVLYRQEGVEGGIYVPIEVNVHTQAGKVLTCRSYQMKDYVCGPPSPQYKKVGIALSFWRECTDIYNAVFPSYLISSLFTVDGRHE